MNKACVIKVIIGALLLFYITYGSAESIYQSKHNLSVSGTGQVKAYGEEEVCIFCHTPHSGSTEIPLWNRHTSSVESYIFAPSQYLASKPPEMPDGDSKLCLSCHDGTVALGNLINIRGRGGFISMSYDFLSQRDSYIGTDLSGSHIISIAFDENLIFEWKTIFRKDCLRLPSRKEILLPPTYPMGEKKDGIQCTTCHDPHDDENGKFLRLGTPDNYSELCQACHIPAKEGGCY
ncbi:MAG: hypothetical protein A2Y62_18320 [Candidatus Fischerbacteria bacterium RBG_13_37_8]|uniref:Doubled CXXCH motif domain-containing protein n=1 Tax=Candidatus Fischerbacteria bacterium RBG_13_37_8 TaxID=1817863 RepID=A0A1F5VP32_9BACT|nr:MAG: hypothetical protein A2Y62_18320 [Candidatus Fischerbacteria bacterium RBG_13_37_8]